MIAPTCDYPGCAKLADVWWEGGWCSTHARAHGRLPALTFRFQEIHRMNQASEPKGLPSPARTGGASSEAPSLGRASVVGSLTASEPGPLTSGASEPGPRENLGARRYPAGGTSQEAPDLSEAELLDILERENWGSTWQD